MIIELEINGARVIISGDNLSVNVTEDCAPKKIGKHLERELPTASQIGALRQRLDLNQDEFGAMFGVSQATVWRWESGSGEPRGDSALKLVRLMNEYFRQGETSGSES